MGLNSDLAGWKDVWVYCHHEEGKLTRPVLETLSAGRKVADKLGQRLVGIVLGYNLGGLVRQPIEYGADEVVYCDDPALKDYLCLPYTSILTKMCLEKKPNVFLFVADEIGRDLAPRLAYRLKTGLATDNIDLDVEDFYHPPTKKTYPNILAQIRPDFATRVAKIYTPRHRPQIATLRPGNFDVPSRQEGRKGKEIRYEASFSEGDFSVSIKEVKKLPSSPVDLENAQAIVSIGLGILRDASGNPKDPLEGYKLAKELASVISEKYGLKTEIGASRALIYANLKELEGLITKDHQIGQTGKTVSPEIYIALGISGAVQHRVGMIRSKKIVAVNIDPKSPIFEVAHYPIIGDIYEVVPKLIEKIRGS